MKPSKEAVERAIEADCTLPENECTCLGPGHSCRLCMERMAAILAAAMARDAAGELETCVMGQDDYGLIKLEDES